jgi:hypothetical protein
MMGTGAFFVVGAGAFFGLARDFRGFLGFFAAFLFFFAADSSTAVGFFAGFFFLAADGSAAVRFFAGFFFFAADSSAAAGDDSETETPVGKGVIKAVCVGADVVLVSFVVSPSATSVVTAICSSDSFPLASGVIVTNEVSEVVPLLVWTMVVTGGGCPLDKPNKRNMVGKSSFAE